VLEQHAVHSPQPEEGLRPRDVPVWSVMGKPHQAQWTAAHRTAAVTDPAAGGGALAESAEEALEVGGVLLGVLAPKKGTDANRYLKPTSWLRIYPTPIPRFT